LDEQARAVQRVGVPAGRSGRLPVSTSVEPRLLGVLSMRVRRRRRVRPGALAARRAALLLTAAAAWDRLRRRRPLRLRRALRLTANDLPCPESQYAPPVIAAHQHGL